MSLRLEPRGLSAAFRLQHVGLGYYFARAYEDALAAFEQAMRSFPELPGTYTWLPAVLGQLGRAEEARQALESAIRIAPAAFNRNVRWQGSFRPEDHAHLLEGLRKAGWKG
jgi:adenylate cyclase